MPNTLLISVRFHDGRYHGSGVWPPSPARLFQALVAGAARGENLSEHAVKAFEWLESLEAPAIAAPPAYSGQPFKNFVPNNDLDAVGGDPARIGKIRAGKIVRPRTFDAAVPLLYAWTFEPSADAERHARAICEVADNLYQLGRGVDMAWATGEVVDEVDAHLRATGGVPWRPSQGGNGTELSCPRLGSLASLMKRFKAMRGRFRVVGADKKTGQFFAQAPKPDFRQVRYNSPSVFLLFEIRNADGFAPQPLERVVALTEKVRDLAVKRLKASAWRRDDPKRETLADKIIIGRDSQEADKARRVRIVPLPSIGHAQTERSIRRVLVAVPPDCPIATGDIAWAFSGLVLVDPETGEVPDDTAELVTASDDTMLAHYGIENAAHLWRTVTAAALLKRAARRRINPRWAREEAKGSAERLREHAAAEWAVQQALRHAGIGASVDTIRVQREPFEGKGLRAEAFAKGSRFIKERLWHVEVGFSRPITGPLLIGDGRYLGLGLMAPVRRVDGIFAFAITGGLMEQPELLGLTRALRRAVMARVQENMGARATLPAFFTGHAGDGAPSRSGRHEHLAFAFDAPRKRLLIVAPHILERRGALPGEHTHLRMLEEALEDFRELRAGAAGKLTLVPGAPDLSDDPLLAPSQTWESLTPYRVTRHAKLNDAAAALEADLLAECRRAGLPRLQVENIKIIAKPSIGLFGLAKLRFHSAVTGPIFLGRDRHFGGGLFVAVG
ncbi:MAG TPA: type I-U CRISPR-associated protein Csb2 [Stellaceae bacterium]|nr:type I-U CRISPR-associated protein Csb2 [Stellaceae bacterium]